MSNQKPALTSISIENFKGIGSRVTIPFKPLMLFFGPNNAGKSTVIEALLLANEVMNGRNPNVDKVELGGDLIRLGGFKSYVHGKDTVNVVKIRIEGSLGGAKLPSYEEELKIIERCENMLADNLDIDAGENKKLDFVERYNLNYLTDIDTFYIESRIEMKERYVWVGYESGINDECLLTTEAHSAFLTSEFDSSEIRFNQAHPALEALSNKSAVTKKILELLATENYDEGPTFNCNHDSYRCLDLTYEQPAEFDMFTRVRNDNSEQSSESVLFSNSDMIFLSNISSQLLVGGRRMLAKLLQSHLFIGPFRKPVPREFVSMRNASDTSWADGSAAWQALLDPNLIGYDELDLEQEIQRIKENELDEMKEEMDLADRKKEAIDESKNQIPIFEKDVVEDVLAHPELDSNYYKDQALEDNIKIKAMENLFLKNPSIDHYRSFLESRIRRINACLEAIGMGNLGLEADVKPIISSEGVLNSVAESFLNSKTQNFSMQLSDKQFKALENELKYGDFDIHIQIFNNKRQQYIDLVDAGFGFSQVAPIVLTLLEEANLISIEQPELHLHPSLQCGLGDLFSLIMFTNKSDAEENSSHNVPRIMVETHSEHMLLRILRRIRETAEQNAPEDLQITPDDLAVFAVEEEEDGTHIYEMEISEEGELLTPWPNGFFPERMQEILGD